MYSVDAYGAMIADEVRMEAYRHALAGVIGTDSVVLDLGAGTGIFSLLACRLGARHVYAVEKEDVIEVARQIALCNGWAERITLIQEDSARVHLPVRADVIVSDIRGRLPLLGKNISSLIDARERLLGASGALIPQQDFLWLTVLSAPQAYESIRSPWSKYDLDMSAARRICLNAWRSIDLDKTIRLTEPVRWAELDYRSIDSADLCADLEQEVVKAGAGHGLLVWFDTSLFDGIGFSSGSSAVDENARVYGSAFFPWLEPVDLAPGDRVELGLQAVLIQGDYVWRWNSRVLRKEKVIADFCQSDFFGQALCLDTLKKKERGYRPRLNRTGLVDQRGLALMTGERSLQEISRQLLKDFPDEFRSDSEALAKVALLSERYSL